MNTYVQQLENYSEQGCSSHEKLYKVQKEDHKQVLHQSIVAITILEGNALKMIATGFLLSSNIIMSSLAAGKACENKKARVFLVSQNGIAQNGLQIESCLYSSGGEIFKNEYSILKLKERVKQNQFLQITKPCQICLLNNNKQVSLEIFGYPKYNKNVQPLQNTQSFRLVQYGLSRKNRIKSINPQKYIIQYSIPTLVGQMGSPLIANDKIIGIHLGVNKNNNSVGRFFTYDLLDKIKLWCQKLKGDPFEINNSNQCIHLENKNTIDKYQDSSQKRWLQMIQSHQSPHRNHNIPPKIQTKYKDKLSVLKYIDLTCRDLFKLTSKNMVLFSKIQFYQLIDLILQNNWIQDRGVQVLCQSNYPALSTINIKDNGLTINCLRHFLCNQWSIKVKYDLESVYSNDEYYLDVGQSLPYMKEIFKSQNLENINLQNYRVLNALNLLLVTPLEDEDPEYIFKTSQKIEEQYLQQSRINPFSVASLMIIFKCLLKDSLIYTKKSDMKTKITLHLILTGLLNLRVKFSQKIKSNGNLKITEFKNNSKKLKEFKEEHIKKLRTDGFDLNEMTIDKISANSFTVTVSSRFESSKTAYILFSDNLKELKIFFERLQLTGNQFESKLGKFCQLNFDEKRMFGKRYRIIESSKCQIKDKDQLVTVFYEQSFITTKANSFLKDRELEVGQQHFPQDRILKNGKILSDSINVTSKVYPWLKDSRLQVQSSYRLILQCKVMRQSLWRANKPNYWVIKRRSEIQLENILIFNNKEIIQFQQNNSSIEEIERAISGKRCMNLSQD